MSERMNEDEVPGDFVGRWFDLAIDDAEIGIDQIEGEYLRRLRRWWETQADPDEK